MTEYDIDKPEFVWSDKLRFDLSDTVKTSDDLGKNLRPFMLPSVILAPQGPQRGLLNNALRMANKSPTAHCVNNGRECSIKSVQQGRSLFDARSVLLVREHGKMARTPLAAFFNIPQRVERETEFRSPRLDAR